MKILIAGSNLNAILLAKYLKLQNQSHDIYLTSDVKCDDNSYTAINIYENDIAGICDFVKYNQIEFTIVTSKLAIINGIADTFKKECFPIFAPFSEAARITFFNSIAKKIMYKLKINTPKFGIFDRENLAIEYVRRSKFPITINNDFTLLSKEQTKYETFSKAKIGIQKSFENNNDKVVIENYIDSEPIYMYFITDGFNALPLISIEREKNKDFSIIKAPSEKISQEFIIKVLRQVIYPLLDDISKFAQHYSGIIGIKLKQTKDNFYILEFYNEFEEYDFQAFLSLLDDDLLKLLVDSANGCLADEHDFIRTTDNYSYSMAIDEKNIRTEDDSDYIESYDKNKIILTNTSSTINYAKKGLIEYVKSICSENILEEIKNIETDEAIKI